MVTPARTSRGFFSLKKNTQAQISDYLEKGLILFLDTSSRDEAIDALIEQLFLEGKLPHKEAFRQAIYQREQLVSTAIGMGVAIPHAKLKGFPDFFVAVGIQKRRGIDDWQALDKASVRLIFLIGGPDDQQTRYLQILSQLTSRVRDPEVRKKLLQTSTPEEVISLLAR